MQSTRKLKKLLELQKRGVELSPKELFELEERMEFEEKLETISKKDSEPVGNMAIVEAIVDKVLANAKGDKGDKGEKGEKGDRGERGEKGEKGDSVRGEKGEKGDKGDRGERGEKGESGADGKIPTDRELAELVRTVATDAVTHIESLEGDDRLSATALKDTDKLRFNASQIDNLPQQRVSGNSGIERILSSGTVVRQGASEINFGNNLTVTRTANGVKVDAAAGSGAWGSITGTLSDQTDLQTALDAKADLEDGKIPTSQLPGLALTDVHTVASEAAMVALTAQEGDVAIRTDENKTYAHNGGTAGDATDWSELLAPTDTVTSVNGETGAVTLDTDDVDEGSTNLYSQWSNGATAGEIYYTGGNVGVGTTDPSQKLTVEGNNAVLRLQASQSPTGYYTQFVNQYSSSNPFYMYVNNYGQPFGLKNIGPGNDTVPYVGGYYGLAFTTGNSTSPSASHVRMAINQAGDVGIGTTNPLVSLQVSGTTNVGTGWVNTSTDDAEDATLSVTGDDATLELVASDAGTVGSIIGLKQVDGTVYENAWGIYRQTNGDGAGDGSLRFSYGTNVNPGANTDMLTISTTGSVGIGTTAPDKKLEVNLGTSDAFRLSYDDANGSATTYFDTTISSTGGVTFQAVGSATGFTFSDPVTIGSYTLPTADGTANQVLKTNGSGTVTWEDDSTGAGGVSDGDKGDISVSDDGATWTIDNDAVTYAKIQDVSATSRILGRVTAGAGNVEELTAANVFDILGVTSTASELNALDGITATVTELNYTDGVTSAIQTQLDAKLEAGDAVMGTIVHGATSGTARPSGFDVVTWIGSVEPSNATDNDIWIDTA